MAEDPPEDLLEDPSSDADETRSQLSAASMLRRASIRNADDAQDAMDVEDGELIDHDDMNFVRSGSTIAPAGTKKSDKKRKVKK